MVVRSPIRPLTPLDIACGTTLEIVRARSIFAPSTHDLRPSFDGCCGAALEEASEVYDEIENIGASLRRFNCGGKCCSRHERREKCRATGRKSLNRDREMRAGDQGVLADSCFYR